MTINITGRKTTIKDSFREEAEREMTRFDRLFDDDASAHITVSNEGGRETVEITIRSGGMIFRAEKDHRRPQAVAGSGRRPAVPSDRKE
ncbi:MAG: HPF/RaiA family ribosome-associated protein [Acutalibacteraceae bacterium]